MRLFNLQEWQDHNIVRLCTFILALLMFSFDIFIYCYMGEQVIEQVYVVESYFIIGDSSREIFSK